MERINQQVESLRLKRKQCDDEADDLKKKLVSCSNAMGASALSQADRDTGDSSTKI